MADDDCAVLVVRCVLRVTSILDVAGKKTDLSSHLNAVFVGSSSTERLDPSVMARQKRTIESNDWVGVEVGDRLDRALLSIAARISGGSNDDVLANFPVERGSVLHVVESDRCGSCRCGCLQISPRDWSLDTMHVKSAKVDTDDLVSEDRNIRVVLRTPHRDGHLGRVAVLGSTNFHVAFDKDVMSVKGSLVVRVSARRENQGALDIEEGELGTGIDVEEQMLTLGNLNGLALLRRQVAAPGLGQAPLADIEETLSHVCDVSKAINIDDKHRSVRNIRLVGGGAGDRSRGLGSHNADTVVDCDCDGIGVMEVGARESHALTAKN